MVVVFAGLKSVVMLAVGLGAAAVAVAAVFFFLSRRGVRRWLSLAVFAAAPIAVVMIYAFAALLRVALASPGAWLLASLTARCALAGAPPGRQVSEHAATPPRPALAIA